MSFKTAKDTFEQALQAATNNGDEPTQQLLLTGLLHMNKALQSQFKDIESRLKALEQLVRRLG